MRIVSGFIVRQIAGETVAIPSGPSARLLSGLISLNGTGQFLFSQLQTEQTEDTLVQAMIDTYEVDRATAQADVLEFLELLRRSHLLIED
jgi:hypothetical protein